MTTEEIYAALTAAFQESSGLSGTCSTELSVRFYAVAAQIQSLYDQCVWVRDQCFPQSAAGVYLDQHAQLRGLARKSAEQAQGTLRFLLEEARGVDVSIPAGTICMTAGMVEFETTQAAVLSAGDTQVDVPAQARVAGTNGNVGAGTILTMAAAPVAVAACTNPLPFSGGTDEEGDDDLRVRVLATYDRLSNGANAAYYEQEALGFDGVAAANVIGRARGIGTVDVIISAPDGLPSQELVDQLQSYFESRREIAVDVQVSAPETESVNVSAAVTLEDSADSVTVLDAVEATVRSFFDGTLLGKGVLRAELISLIFGIPGVANCTLSAPAADVNSSDQILPVLGTLRITEAV